MNIEAVIFDLDGTLIDSMGVWLEVDNEYLLKRNIIPPENLIDDVQGGNSFTEFARYFKEKFDLPDSIQDIMNEWVSMVSDHYRNNIKLKSGVVDFIALLREMNIPIGVGTSNEMKLTKSVLKSNHLYSHIKSIVCGCSDIKGKPFPDIFLQVAKELNVEPQHCLVIEDTLVGVKAAKNAGMIAFAIAEENSANKRNQIIKISDFFAENFDQLKMEFIRRFCS